MKKVIVYGSITLMKMLCYDARDNADFQIAALVSDPDYLGGDELAGLPWVSYEKIQALYPPDEYDMLALFNGYRSMRARDIIFAKAEKSGYQLRNYISPRADVTPDIRMGVNNVIMGNAHTGFGGSMGDNNLIRQGVYLGHEFKIGNNNIIAAGCTIGGHCHMGNSCYIGGHCHMGSSCYIGLGTTIVNHINIADETLAGAGSVVIRDTLGSRGTFFLLPFCFLVLLQEALGTVPQLRSAQQMGQSPSFLQADFPELRSAQQMGQSFGAQAVFPSFLQAVFLFASYFLFMV